MNERPMTATELRAEAKRLMAMADGLEVCAVCKQSLLYHSFANRSCPTKGGSPQFESGSVFTPPQRCDHTPNDSCDNDCVIQAAGDEFDGLDPATAEIDESLFLGMMTFSEQDRFEMYVRAIRECRKHPLTPGGWDCTPRWAIACMTYEATLRAQAEQDIQDHQQGYTMGQRDGYMYCLTAYGIEKDTAELMRLAVECFP